MAQRGEFTVQNLYQYDESTPARWIFSHIWRYRWFLLLAVGAYTTAWAAFSYAQVLVGQAAEEIISPTSANSLLMIALTIMVLLAIDGFTGLTGAVSAENIAARFEADARQELYASLLSKSKTFHDRQRVGDIMARATDDTSQLGYMVVPGGLLMFETVAGILVPMSFIIAIKPELA
ncbi:MAG: ABC transporter transmembrane domain-containing protein, partial [Chloroflexaceae bacterium]|nr:ABC transporter transmembrane domain-containing protein [Chloroflexaceae bacterium]